MNITYNFDVVDYSVKTKLNHDVELVPMIQDLDYAPLRLTPSETKIHDDDLDHDDDDHPDFFSAMNFFDFQIRIHVYYFLSWMVVLDLYVLQELLEIKLKIR